MLRSNFFPPQNVINGMIRNNLHQRVLVPAPDGLGVGTFGGFVVFAPSGWTEASFPGIAVGKGVPDGWVVGATVAHPYGTYWRSTEPSS